MRFTPSSDAIMQDSVVLPSPGVKQNVVERVAAYFCRVDEYRQIFLHLFLPDVFVKRFRTERQLVFTVLLGKIAAGNAAFKVKFVVPRRDCLIYRHSKSPAFVFRICLIS